MNYGQIYNLNCVYAGRKLLYDRFEQKISYLMANSRNFVPISISNKDKDHNLRDVTAFENRDLANNRQEGKSKKRGTNTDSLPITVIKELQTRRNKWCIMERRAKPD